MKKQFNHLKLFLPALLIITAFSSSAQNSFIHIAAKENRSCNGDCTQLDNRELDGNSKAIIFVAPLNEKELNLNPHPICVYYFKSKWNIINLDQAAIPAGAKFTVEYFTNPDRDHFQYLIAREDLQQDGTVLIDHKSLNNNPDAQLRIFHSWVPEAKQYANREEINLKYNPETSKWSLRNINKKSLMAGVAYNIIITGEGNTLAAPIRGNPDILIKEPTTIIKPADPISIITGPLDNEPIVEKKRIVTPYDFTNVHMCFEKTRNNSLPPKTPIPVIPKIKPNGDLEQVSTITQPLSGLTTNMWAPGESISVGFDPAATTAVTNKVKLYCKEWETYASIKFVFLTDISKALIKVGFDKTGKSWSWIGRQALVNPSNEKTMNLGWLDESTAEVDFRRVVLHEFGHALGFIHEHQAPGAGIAWDKEKVYAYYAKPPTNWSSANVDIQILNKYSQSSTNSSAYDMLSIMHYFFPKELTTDGTSFTQNNNLSQLDRAWARVCYPPPVITPTATGVLETGDDCDKIAFTVEYNVVPKNVIEFRLQPGYDQNNMPFVTWWKMIGIPLNSGSVEPLFLNTIKNIEVNMISKTKPITFGKAKFLGIHTGLAFTWPAWPAIVGGCRVKFVWERDICPNIY